MDDAALPPEPPDGGRILDEPLSEALSRRYLAYALSTITQRALPDVRDGLKPVQRRLLYAMRLLRLDPETSAKKSARVVGDVIGKYHPHGDVAVYDALVRLAQDFVQRYPLVDGQGNFGNIDGDNAAAMRYTECRLTEAAQLLLDGIDEDAVDFSAHLRRRRGRAGRAAGRLPEPAGQRLHRHRGRHGDLDPAAQRRRADRRLPDAAGPPGGDHRRADGEGSGSGLPDRRRHRRVEPVAAGSLRDRPRRRAHPRPLDQGGHRPRHLADRRHRDPLPGEEGRPRRADRRPDRGQAGPAAGRRQRRVGRGHPPGAGAARPHRRAGALDGEPVQALRPREPLPDQHERARRQGDAAGDGAEGGAAGLPRPSPRGDRPARQAPARQDRAAAAHPRRPPDRLPQSRRGDPHRPLRGRAEGQADRRLRDRRRAGRRHPQHAAAPARQARGDGAAARARRTRRGARRHPGDAGFRQDAVEAGRAGAARRARQAGQVAPDRRAPTERRDGALDLRRGADDRRRGGGRGAGGARADHRHPLRDAAGSAPRAAASTIRRS